MIYNIFESAIAQSSSLNPTVILDCMKLIAPDNVMVQNLTRGAVCKKLVEYRKKYSADKEAAAAAASASSSTTIQLDVLDADADADTDTENDPE